MRRCDEPLRSEIDVQCSATRQAFRPIEDESLSSESSGGFRYRSLSSHCYVFLLLISKGQEVKSDRVRF